MILGREEKQCLITGVVLILIGVVAAVIFLCQCGAGSWATTIRKTMLTASDTNLKTIAILKEMCRPSLEKCKAEKRNPCPELDECHAARKKIALISESLQLALKLGLVAVDKSDAQTANDKFAEAVLLGFQIQNLMKEWN